MCTADIVTNLTDHIMVFMPLVIKHMPYNFWTYVFKHYIYITASNKTGASSAKSKYLLLQHSKY